MTSNQADFSHQPELTGEQVLLRPFRSEDLGALAEILDDPEVRRFTGSAHLSFDQATLLSFYSRRANRADRLDLAVIDRATGEFVGEMVLNDWDRHNRSCGFRTLLGPRGRGRGLGTEATRLIVGHGFEAVGLHRIQLVVYDFNPMARRVYEKGGFTAEGVEREVLWQDGVWADAIRMSLLAHEWRARRTGDALSEP
ncbi:GNAT family N-acetyltransferase [Micromonosporaceae bacterium Da 78-11]